MSKQFVCCDVDSNGEDIPNSGCGPITHVLFDGYGFGDRQFEGVMFKALIRNGKLVAESVDDWDTDPYLSDFNQKKILKRALDYAKENDIATCPKCGNDVDAQPK